MQASYYSDEFLQGDRAWGESNSNARSPNSNDDVIDVEKLLTLSNEHERLCKEKLHVDFVQSSNAQNGGEMQNKVTIPTGVCDLRVGDRWVTCIVDSGADITVLRQDAVDGKHMLEKSKTKVNLHPAFGRAVQADLINAPCCMRDDNGVQTAPVVITCAVTNELQSHSLLTLQDYTQIMNEGFIPQIALVTGNEDLMASENLSKLNNRANNSRSEVSSALELRIVNAVTGGTPAGVVVTGDNITVEDIGQTLDDDSPLGAVERAMKLHDEMVELQKNDKTIEECWRMASAGKSEFYVRDLDKLLYRKTHMYGFQVHQLVLPESKRKEVLELAHDSLWSGHFASKKHCKGFKRRFSGLP